MVCKFSEESIKEALIDFCFDSLEISQIMGLVVKNEQKREKGQKTSAQEECRIVGTCRRNETDAEGVK